MKKPVPWSLYALAVIGLLWNGMGTFLWAGSTFSPEKFLAELPSQHRAYVQSLPSWSAFTWGLGVLTGLAASILLSIRNRFASTAAILSLVGAVTNQLVYIANPPPEGFVSLPLICFIIGFAALMVWYTHTMKKKGVL